MQLNTEERVYLQVDEVTTVTRVSLHSMAQSKKVEKTIRAAIKQAGKPTKLQELDLSQTEIKKIAPEIKDLIEKCSDLKILKLAECNLQSLENFPKLPNLEDLDVSSNSITDKDLKIIGSNCQKLLSLGIGDNKIQSVASLKLLKPLKELKHLWSEDNPLANDPTYLKVAFETFKQLQSLDGKDSEGKQLQEEFSDNSGEEDGDFQEEGSEQGQEDEEGQGEDEKSQNDEEQLEEQDVKPKKKKR